MTTPLELNPTEEVALPYPINHNVELLPMECPSCHVPFAITVLMEKDRRRSGQTLWCPNGHALSWPGERRTSGPVHTPDDDIDPAGGADG